MIRSISHRGLRKLYQSGQTQGVAQHHVTKLRDILTALDQSRRPADMNLPGFQLHPLRGSPQKYYAVSVSGNWRVTFRFDEGDATDIDYLDYP